MQEDQLKRFGVWVQRIIQKESLTESESYEAFVAMLRNEQPELQQGAFLAALAAKGESIDEIVGAWRAIMKCDTVDCSGSVGSEDWVDNCGTGMDRFKTMNVSTAASIVASACGVPMARHGARALTSQFGTVDMAEALGIDVDCPAETVVQSIQSVGIGLFNGMSASVHPQALGRILSQIRFGSILNIAASLANPVRPRFGVRGVHRADFTAKVAAVMKAIGYERGMVFHGEGGGGMDELSVCGSSHIVEFASGEATRSYTIEPEDVGISRCSPDALRPLETLELEHIRFVEVLEGTYSDACIDFVALNAAAALCVAGRVAGLAEGVVMSREAMRSGKAVSKLHEWIDCQGPKRRCA